MEGFELNITSVYLPLLPRMVIRREGKRHVSTAPVKLISAQNSKHSSHPSTKFARATIDSLEELAGVLGPRQVTFHSQDDKAKVPIGLTAATKQAPLLIHIEYKVTLPDHECLIVPRHKLIRR